MSEIKHFRNLLFLWIRYISQSLSLLILIYIFVTHLVGLVTPTETFIDQEIYDLEYLRNLTFLSFFLGFISWIISFFLKQIQIVSPFTYSRNDRYLLIVTSILLSLFFNDVFKSLHIFQYVVFLAIIVFLIFFIPQFIQLYTTISISSFKFLIRDTCSYFVKKFNSIIFDKKDLFIFLVQQFKPFKIILAYIRYRFKKSSVPFEQIQSLEVSFRNFEYLLIKKVTRLLIILLYAVLSILTLLITVLFIWGVVTKYIEGTILINNMRRKQFYILKINTHKALSGQKVTLIGYHFGWKVGEDNRYKVMLADRSVRLIEEWTNEKLEFIIPLELPTGTHKLWIERPSDDPKNTKILKSNSVNLSIFDRFILYPSENDSLEQRFIKKIRRYIYLNVPMFYNFVLF